MLKRYDDSNGLCQHHKITADLKCCQFSHRFSEMDAATSFTAFMNIFVSLFMLKSLSVQALLI